MSAAERRTLIIAMAEAVRILRAPFSESDEIPGTIQDAIDVLLKGLGYPE